MCEWWPSVRRSLARGGSGVWRAESAVVRRTVFGTDDEAKKRGSVQAPNTTASARTNVKRVEVSVRWVRWGVGGEGWIRRTYQREEKALEGGREGTHTHTCTLTNNPQKEVRKLTTYTKKMEEKKGDRTERSRGGKGGENKKSEDKTCAVVPRSTDSQYHVCFARVQTAANGGRGEGE